MTIDIQGLLDEGRSIALTVACPNAECGAAIGDECRSYLHAVRVYRAFRSMSPAKRRDLEERKSSDRRPFSFGASKWPGLGKLTEEFGEVLQVVGKLMNLDSDGVEHWDGTNLRDKLTDELGDASAAIEFVTKHCKLDDQAIKDRAARKLALFERWHVEQGDKIASDETKKET